MLFLPSSFSSSLAVISILSNLSSGNPKDVRALLDASLSKYPSCPLLLEILFQLESSLSPRILIDGIWLSSQYGGITRVWQQFFSFLDTSVFSCSNHISVISRQIHNSPPGISECIPGTSAGPFDYSKFDALSHENAYFMAESGSDIFCSTWITYASRSNSYTQLALVHDCIPEIYFDSTHPMLLSRRRWLSLSDSFVCVSNQTTDDLKHLFPIAGKSTCWSHPCSPFFGTSIHLSEYRSSTSWSQFLRSSCLPSQFVLLPSSSSLSL